jgi:hypothetical protein
MPVSLFEELQAYSIFIVIILAGVLVLIFKWEKWNAKRMLKRAKLEAKLNAPK